MSMEELVLKMLFCLVAALLIGFLFGWLITRASARGKYTAQIDEINNELIDKNVEVDNLNREITNHHDLKKNLLADLEIKDTELSGLHDVIGRQKNDLLAVKSDLDLKDKKVQELEKVMPSFETKIATLEDAYSAKNSKVVELEEDYNNLRSEIGSLQQEQDKKHEEIQQLVNDKNSYAMKVKDLEDVVNQKNIASLELDQKVKELDNLVRENNQLKENLNQTNSRLESFQNQLKERDSKLASYQNELSSKDSKINAFEDEISQRESKLNSYQNELNERDGKLGALSELNAKNSKLEEEIRAARSEAENYKLSLERSQDQIKELHVSAKSTPTINHERTTHSTSTEKPHLNADLESDEGGFSFIKLAKDTISKFTESGEEIIKRGDDAIDTYKNKKS